jgi:hypothetical protein
MSPQLSPPDEQATPSPSDATPRGGRRVRWQRPPGLEPDTFLSVAVWLVSLPVAAVLVRALDLDPFTVAAAIMPMAVGSCAAIVLLTLAWRRTSDALVGVGAGLYAGWMALTMATALHGTPYPYGLLGGDEGRLLAQAGKSMTNSGSVDSFIHTLPSEYPPLYPWVLGHVAKLLDQPAWKVAGNMEIVVMSASFVVGYVLWRRLVGARTAFVIMALFASGTAQPSKDYEYIALIVAIPWLLMAFADLPRARGRMHWLTAGVIGGLMVTTYSAYIVFTLPAILVMIGLALHRSTERLKVIGRMLGIAVTAFVVASWYVVPFAVTSLRDGGNRLSDLYLGTDLISEPITMTFLHPTPRGAIELVGLLGMIWFRRTKWWAQPLLLLTLSAYGYRLLFMLNTVHNNHTGYLQYTTRLLAGLLATAGVLTVVETLPMLRARLSLPRAPLREVVLALVAIVVLWNGVQGWNQWVPGPRGARDAYREVGTANLATAAHNEPLLNGHLPKYAPPGEKKSIYFPVPAVTRAITSAVGAKTRPMVLCYDQRLYVFEPMLDGYLPPDRQAANTVQRWDDRAAELRRVAKLLDPAQFADASAHTQFGGIDAFVLKEQGDVWSFRHDITFSPASFGSQFVITHVSPDTVVAVRRP